MTVSYSGQIRGKEDADGLQHDLDTVVEWSHRLLMSFNPKKCSVLKITQNKQPRKKYTLGPRYWNIPVLVNTGTILVYQHYLEMCY